MGGSYVVEEMKKKNLPCKDIVNAFIWSGFNYYLKKPNDYYIVYAPIKYWKKDKLVNKRAYEAYLLNRKRFTAPTDAAISLIRWGNEEFSGNQVLRYILNNHRRTIMDNLLLRDVDCDGDFINDWFFDNVDDAENKDLKVSADIYAGDDSDYITDYLVDIDFYA